MLHHRSVRNRLPSSPSLHTARPWPLSLKDKCRQAKPTSPSLHSARLQPRSQPVSASGTAAASARATAPAECSSCFYFVLQSNPSDRCTFSPKIPTERSAYSKALSFRDLLVHELSEFFSRMFHIVSWRYGVFSDILCFTIHPETKRCFVFVFVCFVCCFVVLFFVCFVLFSKTVS